MNFGLSEERSRSACPPWVIPPEPDTTRIIAANSIDSHRNRPSWTSVIGFSPRVRRWHWSCDTGARQGTGGAVVGLAAFRTLCGLEDRSRWCWKLRTWGTCPWRVVKRPTRRPKHPINLTLAGGRQVPTGLVAFQQYFDMLGNILGRSPKSTSHRSTQPHTRLGKQL